VQLVGLPFKEETVLRAMRIVQQLVPFAVTKPEDRN